MTPWASALLQAKRRSRWIGVEGLRVSLSSGAPCRVEVPVLGGLGFRG